MDWTKAKKRQLLTIALTEDCPIELKYRACSELEERKKWKTKTYVVDGIEYTTTNHRMRYNPEFHENYRKPYTVKEVAYLCSMYGSMKAIDIAAALGRTHASILRKVDLLRKSGEFENFKKIGDVLGA